MDKLNLNGTEYAQSISASNKLITVRKYTDGFLSWDQLDNNFELLRVTVNASIDSIGLLETWKTSTIGDLASLSDGVAGLDTSVAALETWKTSAESSITVLETWKTSAESSITTLETWKTAAESSITTLETWKTSADSRITALENSDVAAIEHEGTVYVDDFGAVGDGLTDDTAAIQAAIDSLRGTPVSMPDTYVGVWPTIDGEPLAVDAHITEETAIALYNAYRTPSNEAAGTPPDPNLGYADAGGLAYWVGVGATMYVSVMVEGLNNEANGVTFEIRGGGGDVVFGNKSYLVNTNYQFDLVEPWPTDSSGVPYDGTELLNSGGAEDETHIIFRIFKAYYGYTNFSELNPYVFNVWKAGAAGDHARNLIISLSQVHRYDHHADLVIKENVTLRGVGGATPNRRIPSAVSSTILLGGGSTLLAYACTSILNLTVMRQAEYPLPSSDLFEGYGIRVVGDDVTIRDCFIGGFEYGVYCNWGPYGYEPAHSDEWSTNVNDMHWTGTKWVNKGEDGTFGTDDDYVEGGSEQTRGSGRLLMYANRLDNLNGIHIRTSYDVCKIRDNHQWPWLTGPAVFKKAHMAMTVYSEFGSSTTVAIAKGDRYWAFHGKLYLPANWPHSNPDYDHYTFRQGSAISLWSQNDWTKIMDNFSYGYKIGIECDGTNIPTLQGNGQDNVTGYIFQGTVVHGSPSPRTITTGKWALKASELSSGLDKLITESEYQAETTANQAKYSATLEITIPDWDPRDATTLYDHDLSDGDTVLVHKFYNTTGGPLCADGPHEVGISDAHTFYLRDVAYINGTWGGEEAAAIVREEDWPYTSAHPVDLSDSNFGHPGNLPGTRGVRLRIGSHPNPAGGQAAAIKNPLGQHGLISENLAVGNEVSYDIQWRGPTVHTTGTTVQVTGCFAHATDKGILLWGGGNLLVTNFACEHAYHDAVPPIDHYVFYIKPYTFIDPLTNLPHSVYGTNPGGKILAMGVVRTVRENTGGLREVFGIEDTSGEAEVVVNGLLTQERPSADEYQKTGATISNV